jgi:hypothetical protein
MHQAKACRLRARASHDRVCCDTAFLCCLAFYLQSINRNTTSRTKIWRRAARSSRLKRTRFVMLKSLRPLDSCRVVFRSSCCMMPSDRWVGLASPRMDDTLPYLILDTLVAGSEAQGRHHHLQRERAQAAGASKSRNAIFASSPSIVDMLSHICLTKHRLFKRRKRCARACRRRRMSSRSALPICPR